MAFIRVEVWDTTAEVWPNITTLQWNSSVRPLLSHRAEKYLRNGFATLLTALVHVALLLFLLSRVTGGETVGEGGDDTAGAMALLDLSDPSVASPNPNRQASRLPEDPISIGPISPVDATSPTEIPDEWSIVKIAAQSKRSAPFPAASASLAAASGSGQSGKSAGAGGDSAYDPFAGAAPLQRDRDAEARKLASLAAGIRNFLGMEGNDQPFELDGASLRRLMQGQPRGGARGTAQFQVRVSPKGAVIDIKSIGGTATIAARRWFENSARGKRLYRPMKEVAQPQYLMLSLNDL